MEVPILICIYLLQKQVLLVSINMSKGFEYTRQPVSKKEINYISCLLGNNRMNYLVYVHLPLYAQPRLACDQTRADNHLTASVLK